MLSIKDMPLNKKLLGGFGIVVVLLVIVGLVGYNGISVINSELAGIVNNDVVMADSAMEMKIAGLMASDSIGEQLLGQSDAREQFKTSIKKFEDFESKINYMDLNDEEKKDMADIARLNKNFVESANELFAVIDAAKLEKNNNINEAMEKFDADRLKLNEALEEFEVMQSAEMEQAKAKAQDTAQNASILIASITIIASIIGFGIGFYISRLITKPVEEVLAGSREISNGNLDVKLINNSKDEIGMLSSTFQNMAKDLQVVIGDANNVLAAMSEGDLTKSISVQAKGDFEKITTGIANMQKNLQELILSMKNSAEKVASTAQELSASSEEMKASTDQISSNTQDIATGVSSQATKMAEISRAMKEMSESVQQVAVNSQKAADSATNANKTAREVQVNVTRSATLIKDLDNKSLQIGEIIGVITNIA
ncbi:MAG: methyl-accepting chemotaxis protein, partial [Candidatus Methanoperedens sp.]